MPRHTAEAKRNFRFEHDAATNTSRQLFIPPTDGERAALIAIEQNLEARLIPAPPCSPSAMLRQLKYMPHQKGILETDAAWNMLYDGADTDLGEFSVSHLAEARDEYRRTATYFPAIAEIRAICVRLKEDDERRLRRAKMALYGPENAPSARHNPPAADWDVRHTGPRDFSAIYAALAGKGRAPARA